MNLKKKLTDIMRLLCEEFSIDLFILFLAFLNIADGLSCFYSSLVSVVFADEHLSTTRTLLCSAGRTRSESELILKIDLAA